MTEAELREKCNLGPGELINTNLGLLDLMGLNGKGEAVLGMLATGEIVTESVNSVIKKLKDFKAKKVKTCDK